MIIYLRLRLLHGPHTDKKYTASDRLAHVAPSEGNLVESASAGLLAFTHRSLFVLVAATAAAKSVASPSDVGYRTEAPARSERSSSWWLDDSPNGR